MLLYREAGARRPDNGRVPQLDGIPRPDVSSDPGPDKSRMIAAPSLKPGSSLPRVAARLRNRRTSHDPPASRRRTQLLPKAPKGVTLASQGRELGNAR
jgi:hypothetical protein